jgi:phage host-nuclease inhibitor protein Gam
LQETYSSSLKEKNQFLREIGQVREEIVRFKTEMNGLAKQMDGMEIDLVKKKDITRKCNDLEC